jgi:hypothetical protein
VATLTPQDVTEAEPISIVSGASSAILSNPYQVRYGSNYTRKNTAQGVLNLHGSPGAAGGYATPASVHNKGCAAPRLAERQTQENPD